MDIELFKLEIQDVKHNISALQHRVDKLEEIASCAQSPSLEHEKSKTRVLAPGQTIDQVLFDGNPLSEEFPKNDPANLEHAIKEERHLYGSFLSKELNRRELPQPDKQPNHSNDEYPNPSHRDPEPAPQKVLSISAEVKSPAGTPKPSSTRVIAQQDMRFACDEDRTNRDANCSNGSAGLHSFDIQQIVTSQPGPEKKKEGLEVLIGKHLNKIGISFLVLGCALALVYQFQYFTPLLKILSGIFAAVGLIVAGEYFEQKKSYEWYGRSLTGGGWALGYFAVYAAYHFDSVRVVDSGFFDFALLLAVAAGALWHSFKYRSETITCISLSLAFVTITFSEITAFSLSACALLVMALAAITLRMRWYNLMVYGEVMVYLIYFAVVLPKVMYGTAPIAGLNFADANYTISALFSSLCWAVFEYVNIAGKYKSKSERNYIIASTLINAMAYVPTMLIIMGPSHQSWRFPFLLACAAGYGLSSVSANRNQLSAAVTVQTFIALTLASFAIPFKFSGDWIPALWCVEVPLLIWTGLRYEMPVLRNFAGVLAAVVSWQLLICWTASIWSRPLNWVLGSTAVAAFAISSNLYRSLKPQVLHQSKNKTAFNCYFYLAVLSSLGTIGSNIGVSWLTMCYVLVGTAITLLGFKLEDKLVRATGLTVIFTVGSISYLCSLHAMSHFAMAAIVGVLYYLAETYKQSNVTVLGSESRLSEYSLFAAATIVLTALIHLACMSFISAAWSFEGLAFLLCGFALNDKRLRIAACAILSLVACQFFNHDASQIFMHNNTWATAGVAIFGIVVHERFLLASFDCLILSAAASCYLVPRLQEISGKEFARAFYYYALLTGSIVALTTLHEAQYDWLPLAFTLECMAAIAIGTIFPSVKQVRSLATIGMLISQPLLLATSLGHWNGYATVLLIALQFVTAFYYRSLDSEKRVAIEQGIEHCYGAAGSVTLAFLLAQIMPANLLTIAWTFEAITILALGFRLQSKPYRMEALLLIGIVIGRLLFVELASLETIYRILSFIAAGIVMLLASFAYARFSSSGSQQDAHT